MKKTINESQFIQAFEDYGRGDNFSIEAREKLFEWYEELEEDTGEEIELDVIAICCDWSEFESVEEAKEELGVEDVMELEEYYIELDNGGILIMNY